MAAGLIVLPPYFPARNRNDNLVSGALLYVYENRITTKVTVYSDEALTVPASNPIVANSSGRFPNTWAESGTEADPVLYTLAITGPEGESLGNNSVFHDYRPSVDFDVATVALADAAVSAAEGYAEDAEQALADVEAAIEAATEAGGGDAALAGALAGQAAADAVVATKLDKLSALASLPVAATGVPYRVGYRTAPGDGYAGEFEWIAGDQSANVTADPLQGVWVAPSAAPTGASGAFKRVFNGAVRAEWFGARADYDESDPAGSTENGVAINAALRVSDAVHVSRGLYRVSQTVDLAPYQTLTCLDSGFKLDFSDGDIFDTGAAGAVLVPWDMPKVHTLDAMVTQCELSGGVIPNPNAADAYTSSSAGRLDDYRLIDFTNEDAAGATAATQRAFSTAVKMGRGARLIGIDVRSPTPSGLLVPSGSEMEFGDNCDVGVWAINAIGGLVQDASISWNFRDAALLIMPSLDEDDPSYFPQADRFGVNRCYIEGHASVAVRSYDRVRVSAVSSTTIRVKFFKSHLFPATGSITADGEDYTYGSLTYDGGTDELVFGSLSANPVSNGLAIGDTLYRTEDGDNFGTGGCWINSSFIRSISHPTSKPTTSGDFSDPFPMSGRVLELSGGGVRGIHISNTYIHGREDVMFFANDARDVYFSNSYAESKYLDAGGFGSGASRWIGLSLAEKIARGIPEPIATAGDIHFVGWSQTESGSDMRPIFRTASNYNRLGTGTGLADGLFSPEKATNDAYDFSPSLATAGNKTWRAPLLRGSEHPYIFTSSDGTIRASMDKDGRWGFGFGWSTTADFAYAGNFFFGGSSILNVENTSNTNQAGYRAANTAGDAEFRVDSDGGGILRNGGITRLKYVFNYLRPNSDNAMALGGTSNRWTTGYFRNLRTDNLATYADNAAAIAGGLGVGDFYRTSTGQVMVRY